MRKVRSNIRSFLPHRKRRVISARRGPAPGPRARVLAVVPAIVSQRARRPRLRVVPALAVSVALHGMAVSFFFYVASLAPVKTKPDKWIAVELAEPPATSPRAPAEPAARSDVGPRRPARKQIRRPRRVHQRPQVVAAAAPTPPVEKTEILPPVQSLFDGATPATAAVPTTEARATSTAAAVPRPAVQAISPQALPVANAEIESRLRTATQGCYPYAAVRANQEGVTKLGFCVGRNGAASQVRIVQSSGSRLLDNAALECILPAAMPFPPAEDLCVTVPIRFQLRP
jgi:protein TonB